MNLLKILISLMYKLIPCSFFQFEGMIRWPENLEKGLTIWKGWTHTINLLINGLKSVARVGVKIKRCYKTSNPFMSNRMSIWFKMFCYSSKPSIIELLSAWFVCFFRLTIYKLNFWGKSKTRVFSALLVDMASVAIYLPKVLSIWNRHSWSTVPGSFSESVSLSFMSFSVIMTFVADHEMLCFLKFLTICFITGFCSEATKKVATISLWPLSSQKEKH